MRIIGGQYKGRRIPVSKNLRARPTTDFARENLFNIFANQFDFKDCSVLDLFSGTGSISYEFASRGAKETTLVEQDGYHFRFIKNVIEQLGFGNIYPVRGKAEVFLNKTNKTYDIIFADPPYNSRILPKMPQMVFQNDVLNKNGWFVLEHSQNDRFNENTYFKELRRYGSVHFSIFENR